MLSTTLPRTRGYSSLGFQESKGDVEVTLCAENRIDINFQLRYHQGWHVLERGICTGYLIPHYHQCYSSFGRKWCPRVMCIMMMHQNRKVIGWPLPAVQLVLAPSASDSTGDKWQVSVFNQTIHSSFILFYAVQKQSLLIKFVHLTE